MQTSLAQLILEDGLRRQVEARAAALAGGRRWQEEESQRKGARNGGW